MNRAIPVLGVLLLVFVANPTQADNKISSVSARSTEDGYISVSGEVTLKRGYKVNQIKINIFQNGCLQESEVGTYNAKDRTFSCFSQEQYSDGIYVVLVIVSINNDRGTDPADYAYRASVTVTR